MKNKFFSKLKNFISPIVRGTIKTVPLGNVAIEIIDAVKERNKDIEKVISISVQILGICGILYALVTKQIDIEKYIDLLNAVK